MSRRVLISLPRRFDLLYQCSLRQYRAVVLRHAIPNSFSASNQKFLKYVHMDLIRPFHTSYNLHDYPSHVKVNLPALSPTMELGTIVSWQKKEGDQLNEGDLLCEIETDKATMGFETPEEGFLAKILVTEGTKDIPIGKLLCIIVENKEDVDAFRDFSSGENTNGHAKSSDDLTHQSPALQQQISIPSISVSPTINNTTAVVERIRASPYAKKIATETGVDLSTVIGSGPDGRILSKDMNSTNINTAVQMDSHDHEDIPLSNMRRSIAKRLSESKRTIPHYYLTSEIFIDDLLSVRIQLNNLLQQKAEQNKKKFVKLSINDFIIKASALSCLHVPEANSFFMDTFIRQNRNVDVSVAVSTDVGLITPIIFNAHQKGIATISNEISVLATKAREGKLQPHEFQGGTFTVSNLGMFGSVDHFTAIINPPQSCILAIGSAKKKFVPTKDNDLHHVVTVLNVTLSCDHRVVDGAVGAVWLKHFKSFLEQPHSMLL